MKKQHVGAAWIMGLWISVMLLAPGIVTAEHTGQVWQGSQNCLTCHESQAKEMYGSSHYQWQGEALYTTNGPEIQGKLTTAFNSYCVSILGNWNACGTCHAGLGAMPVATATPAPSQLQNIDCLICHQKDYKRKKVNGVFVPDTANMTITMDQAVQTVHLPVRANCIQCHAKGGGGDNNKRGDMALAHATTTDRNFDVHMSTTGANLTCQQCHTTQNHRIAGRGSDLRQTDLDVQMNCSTAACHPTKMTATGHVTADVNKHVNRVACQTCHIKTYARNAADTTGTESTEVDRDWTIPVWSAALNRWEPEIFRGSDLKPAYAFWNGTSWNYSLNELTRYEATTGTYATSRPEGGINESGSKLYPFKYKTALQPLATLPDVLVALDTAVYFSTGVYDTAVKAGLVNMGHPNSTPYQNVKTDTYQLITHEVMPKGNALTCTQCHTSTATQMNLKSTGYAMKGTQSTTCTQCHGSESIPSYTSLHSRHVTSQRYDCSYCHNFSRPERGLKMPAGSDSTAPTVTGFTIPSTATSLTVTISTLTATDNIGVAGYIVTESATKPLATATGWTPAKPASYTFVSAGAKTLYAWAKDAAGNVSSSRSGSVTITFSQSDTTAPTVSAFSIPASSSSLTVPISTFTASDNVGVTGYLLTATSTKPSAAATGWASAKPANYTFATAGAKTLYAWAKDAAGNVSNALTGQVTITLSTPDTTAPVVSAFSIPASSTSLTVAIASLTASDSVGVTGYLLTETSTKPSATATGWAAAKPASYTFATAGTKTLYAWAKDAAGNVSASLRDSVTITISTGVADLSTSSSLEIGSTEVGESTRKTLEIKNRGTARLTVTKIEVVGADASVFKPSVTAFNLDRYKEYDLRITFKPTARRTFSATLRIYSNDPDTPVKQVALSGKGE